MAIAEDKDLNAFKESQEEVVIDTTRKLRVGFIGCGWIAGSHIKSFMKQPDVEIVAGADLVPGKAKAFFEKTGVDFLVIPGEEVHSPDNPVHLINMGGKESVNDWWRYHEDEYRAALVFCLFCERLFASLIAERGARSLQEIATLASIISEELEYSEENTWALMR